MELTIDERLTLMLLLPNEGKYNMLKLLRVLREELSFTDEEHKQLEIRNENNRVIWNLEKSKGYVKDIHVGEILSDIIRDKLQKLETEGKLMEVQMSLYEKFVVEN